MLKVDRSLRKLSQMDNPTLTDAKIVERSDLQEYIFNSSEAFFSEIGEEVFLIGKEVSPSQTIQDRIDLLGIDREGAAVIVELKRGSNKLQMLQAISYAGMVARWNPEDFRNHISDVAWDELTDFLEGDVDDINRRQRLLLIAEGYDYALLAGAEWLTENHAVDIRCASLTLSTDRSTDAEYLTCTSIFPPPALAEQAVARGQTTRQSQPLKWSDWDEAIAQIDNTALAQFAREELDRGRDHYLRKRSLHYRQGGRRRWSLTCRTKHAYVWQRGRFPGDTEFWRNQLRDPSALAEVKDGKSLRFKLFTEEDFEAFRKGVEQDLVDLEWGASEENGTNQLV